MEFQMREGREGDMGLEVGMLKVEGLRLEVEGWGLGNFQTSTFNL
jgi:hypothetical protein